MFGLFFFFVSLVFINLLNAYAVANVQKIESMAETSNQINRIETVLFFERFIQTTLRALGPFGRRKWVSIEFGLDTKPAPKITIIVICKEDYYSKYFCIQRQTFIVGRGDNKWIEVQGSSEKFESTTTKKVWSMFRESAKPISRSTILRAKERLLGHGFQAVTFEFCNYHWKVSQPIT